MNDAVLQLENVSVAIHQREILRDISLTVAEGQICAIFGHNGAGKTTLLHSIMGLWPVTAGAMSYRGVSLKGLDTGQVVKLGISLVPQIDAIFPNLTTQEHFVLSAHPGPIDLDYVQDLFPRLRERHSQYVGTMSGGERRMVAIAMALLTNSKLILLDELSVGLAPHVVDTVMSVLKRVADDKGISMLLVEQDVPRTLGLASYGYVMNQGSIIYDGDQAVLRSVDIWALL